jgi:hypothetical protein
VPQARRPNQTPEEHLQPAIEFGSVVSTESSTEPQLAISRSRLQGLGMTNSLSLHARKQSTLVLIDCTTHLIRSRGGESGLKEGHCTWLYTGGAVIGWLLEKGADPSMPSAGGKSAGWGLGETFGMRRSSRDLEGAGGPSAGTDGMKNLLKLVYKERGTIMLPTCSSLYEDMILQCARVSMYGTNRG